MRKVLTFIIIAALFLTAAGCGENQTDSTQAALSEKSVSGIEEAVSESSAMYEAEIQSSETREVGTSDQKSNVADQIGSTTAPKDEGNVTIANSANTQLIKVELPAAEEGIKAKHQRDYWPTQEWKTTTPEEQGIDSSILKQVDSDIAAKGVNIRSLLVIKNGYIIFEKYYKDNYGINTRDEIASATKSFSSALIGIALREGYIDNIDSSVVSILPEVLSESSSESASKVTIRNILEMTSGFDWMDSVDEYPAMTSGDPLKYLFAKHITNDPGIFWNYNTLGSHTLSALIQKTTNLNTAVFANAYLFQPLGIKNWDWVQVYGLPLGGHSIFLTTRDFAKFGYLYLNEGLWENKQIIPSEWVKASLTPYNDAWGSSYQYGYQWWIDKRVPSAYFAVGAGDQIIYMVPELDLEVVTTTDNYMGANSFTMNNSVIYPIVDAISAAIKQ
ncbi:MAG TPA: serine hydrolase [Clostridia bacterium]|nr:serine hydrolase [Clostridia bacterium]